MQPPVETAIQWLYDTMRYHLLARSKGGSVPPPRARGGDWVKVCWDIGHSLTMMQAHDIPIGQVIESVSSRLVQEFTGTGLRPADFQMMRLFYLTYFERPRLLPRLEELSWDCHTLILTQCRDPLQQEFYLDLCAVGKLGRKALAEAIKAAKYEVSSV